MIAPKLFTPHPLLTDGVRLRIMALLAASDVPLSFNQIVETLGLTKGNLSAHMSRLESDGLVDSRKQFVNKRSLTTYECTQRGRETLNAYLEQIQSFLEEATKTKTD